MIDITTILEFINDPELQETIRTALFYAILIGFPVGNLLLESYYYEDRKTYCTQANMLVILRGVVIVYAIFIAAITILIFVEYGKIFIFGILYEIVEMVYYLYGRWAVKKFYTTSMSYHQAKQLVIRLENALGVKTVYTVAYVLSVLSAFGVIE